MRFVCSMAGTSYKPHTYDFDPDTWTVTISRENIAGRGWRAYWEEAFCHTHLDHIRQYADNYDPEYWDWLPDNY